MINLKEFLVSLDAQAIKIFVENGKLKTASAAGAITPEIAQTIRSNKAALIELLERSVQASHFNEIPRVPRDGLLPLSFAQRRLWFIDQLEGKSNQYNMPVAFNFTGQLSYSGLKAALYEVVMRHEVLRTNFAEHSGSPVQLIRAEAELDIPLLDLSAETEEKQRLQLGELVSAENTHQFNLSDDLLLRVRLVKLAGDRHVVIFNMHHIISDGWSMDVIIKEFAQLYQLYLDDAELKLPELSIQYADYSAWQRDWLSGQTLTDELRFWQDQLTGAAPEHSLPLDRPRPADQNFSGRLLQQNIDQATAAALNGLCQRYDVTMFMLLQTVFAVLLQRYSNSNDIIMGTAMAGRDTQVLENLAGLFVNSLVLRTDLSGNPSFADLLTSNKQAILEAYAHQYLPFDMLVEHLNPERVLSHNPVFQIMFVVQNTENVELRLSNLLISPFEREHTDNKFDLHISIYESANGIDVNWIYNSDIFLPDSIKRMMDSYAVLLAEVGQQPRQKIGNLNLLTPAAMRALTAEQNTLSDLPEEDYFIHQLFERRAGAQAQQVAAVCGDEIINYGDLNKRANRLARFLIAHGIQPETLVGLCAKRSIDMLVGMLGILKAGGAYVPLDPTYPASRIQFMVEDSELSIALADGESAATLVDCNCTVVNIDDGSADDYPDSNLDTAETGLEVNHLAYIIYTSGSTGEPKGVMVEHQNLTRLFTAGQRRFAYDENDVWTLFHSYAFDFSVWEIWGALAFGGRLVIVPPGVAGSPEAFSQLICEQQVTILNQTPSAFYALQEALVNRPEQQLRYVIFGGEALELRKLEPWFRQTPQAATQLVNGYGITETTVFTTFFSIDKEERRNQIIGKPLDSLITMVCNEAGQVQPVNVPGEIYIAGRGVTRGYLNKPALTAERFVVNPAIGDANQRWYKSGDIARRLADGNLEYVGRVDHQVKLRGFRIELGEIEHLLQAHQAVEEAVVLVCDTGQDNKQLVAYVKPNITQLNQLAGDFESARVEEWEGVFEDAYDSESEVAAGPGSDAETDIAGWVCSYRNALNSVVEMTEWAEGTVESILGLQPKNVLEIGAGTGLLLYRYAAACESVVATDISAKSLAGLNGELQNRGWQHVELIQGDAVDAFTQLDGRQFDTIILNSVAQYFPSKAYFHQVLEGMLNALSDGGRLFLGDLRNLDLLEAFATSVTVFQAQPDEAVENVRRSAVLTKQNDDEFLISPSFFTAFSSDHEGLIQTDILVKHGEAVNEMLRYRYDAVLHKNCTMRNRVEQWHAWQDDQAIERLLADGVETVFGVYGFPNGRIAGDVLITDKLLRGQALSVGELQSSVSMRSWGGLARLRASAAENGFQTFATWSQTQPDLLDLIFVAEGQPMPVIQAFGPYRQTNTLSAPELKGLARFLLPDLKAHLEQGLPKFMVPHAYMLLDKIPLNHNGKIDTAALPEWVALDQDSYVPAESETEEKLQQSWQRILNQPQISVESNFFDLGGHSLLAIRLISDMREDLAVELQVRNLFENPTIRQLAGYIDGLSATLNTSLELPAITSIDRQAFAKGIPLSFSQRRLWYVDFMEGSSAQYNMFGALQITGQFDIEVAEQAIAKVIQRHEVLRTIFKQIGEDPVQIVQSEAGFSLPIVDGDGLSDAAYQALVHAQIDEERVTPFQLDRDLMLRARYVRYNTRSGVLIFNMHHIASDGWSIGILVNDFAHFYASIAQNRDVDLPALPLQYVDYACWQRNWMQGDALQQQLQYWQQHLSGLPSVHSLPLDHPRPPQQTYAGAWHHFSAGKSVLQNLKQLANEEQASLFMVLHAAFSLLLSRYSDNTDIVVGTSVANRLRKELEHLVGFFVNTVVLRTNCEGDQDFRGYLQHVREVNLSAQANQHVPFDMLVEHMQPERDPRYFPLVQILFTMDTNETSVIELDDLAIAPVAAKEVSARYDLLLDATETDDAIHFHFTYNTDLFDSSTIQRLSHHLVVLLETVAADPGRSIHAIPLLDAVEFEQQYQTFNLTRRAFSDQACIQDLFALQAEQSPDATALVFAGESMSYRELDEASNRVAHFLRGSGVTTDTLVGLCCLRSFEMVIGLLGILKAGGAYVPLDPDLPAARLEFMVRDSGLTTVVTTSESLAAVENLAVSTLILNSRDAKQQLAQQPDTAVEQGQQQSSAALAYVIYTSGSTGEPKGVLVTHQAIINKSQWTQQQFPLAAGDAVLQKAPFTFDRSAWEFVWPLTVGARLVLAKPEGHKDPLYLCELIQQQQITALHFVPSMFRAMLDCGAWARCTSVRDVFCGGEVLTADMQAQHYVQNNARLHNVYGPTEAAVTVSHWYCDPALEPAVIPIGQPIQNTELFVLNRGGDQIQPIGCGGELVIAGVGLARGYLKRDSLTQRQFIQLQLPSGESRRVYRSGDLARMTSEGNLEFIGRLDHQVKLRGLRIELGEVENQLAALNEVAYAAVLLRQDQAAGGQLVAYVQPSSDGADGVALKQHLKTTLADHLPDYMVPEHYMFLEKMPLTGSGKIDRQALPEYSVESLPDTHLEPSTETEYAVAAVWADLLQIEPSAISADATFFELGGHSLLMIKLIARLRSSLQTELAVKDVFGKKLSELAAYIDQTSAVEEDRIPLIKNREAPQAISYAQQRLWFIDQLEGGSPQYNMAYAFAVEGAFSAALAERAFRRIIQRHEVLRTVFRYQADQAVQLIQQEHDFHLQQHNLSELSVAEQQTVVHQAIIEDAMRPFDLSQDLMLRGSYFQLSDSNGVLLFNIHHIAADGWSIGLLLQEFATQYKALQQDLPDPLPPLPIQYADYSAWQRDWLAGDGLEQQLAYWDKQLADLPPVHDLPLDHPRPAEQSSHGDYLNFFVDQAVYRELVTLAKNREATLFMVLHAVLSLLLSRYSNSHDIVIGTPVANRLRGELEALLGFFVNPLVLRTSCSGEQSFIEYLEQVKRINLEAQENQETPFEYLVDRLQPERSQQYSPLFQIMFSLGANEIADTYLDEVTIKPLNKDEVLAKYDIQLNASESDAGITFSMTFNCDLFERSTMERFGTHLVNLLTAVVSDPERSIHRLPLLSRDELDYQLLGLNSTETDFPATECVHSLFEQQVRRSPQAVALVFADQQMTYAELDLASNRLARYLLNLGVQPETLVGVCCQRSLDMVIGMLAILKAGGAYVPMDPQLPRARLAYMAQDCQLEYVLTVSESSACLAGIEGQPVILDETETATAVATMEGAGLSSEVDWNSATAAYVIYTSGSTGQPKGVAVEHVSLVNNLDWMQARFGLEADDCMVQKAPFSFDRSVAEIFWPLLYGARLVIAKPDGHKDPAYLAELIQEQQVSVIHFVPSMFRAMLEAGDWAECTSLRYVICGGEALSADLPRLHYRNNPAQLHNVYGPTETTIAVSHWYCDPAVPREVVPIGYPIQNTELFILNQADQLQPMGSAGELCIGGVSVSRGYLGQPGLNQQQFVNLDLGDGASRRLYRSGDLARVLPEGEIEFLGRIDHQVKVRGLRIELGEIESHLLRSPQVLQAAVTVAGQAETGGELIAYIQPAAAIEDQSALQNGLQAVLRNDLPDYMVPERFMFVQEMPTTVSGKIDRKALPEYAVSTHAEGLAPSTQTEKKLAEIWAQLLRLEIASISAGDNFFELGGHSLLTLKLLTRLRAAFNVKLSVKQVFNKGSLADMARLIDLASDTEAEAGIPVLSSRSAPLALSYAQQRLWFIDQLEGRSPQYNMAFSFEVEGEFSEAVAEQAFSRIIQRHEVLRTVFRYEGEKAVQLIRDQFDFHLVYQNLSELSSAQQKSAIEAAVTEDASRPFDLGQDLMLRAQFLRCSDTFGVLIFNMHHIASDGWSIGILFNEFVAQYQAIQNDQPDPLPDLAVQYADYAIWQRRWLADGGVDKQLQYWDRQLDDLPRVHSLPLDNPRPDTPSNRGANYSFSVGDDVAERLRGIALQQQATLFMVLHAAFSLVLARHSNNNDIVIGTPMANRLQQDVEGLIGFFVNPLALRTNCSGNPSFLEYLQRVKQVNLDAQENQETPFEYLVDRVQPERSGQYSPVFQIMFSMGVTDVEAARLEGLSITPLRSGEVLAKYEIQMNASETPTGLNFSLTYNSDIFARPSIAGLTAHLVNLLTAISINPECEIHRLPMLETEEVEQQLMNADRLGPYTNDAGFHDLFMSQAQRSPHAIALSFEGRDMTYQDLDTASNQLAHHLQSLGVGTDQLVGLCCERSLEMIVAVLGILKAGGAYVPLDPGFPQARLDYMIQDCALSVVITTEALRSRVQQPALQVVALDAEDYQQQLQTLSKQKLKLPKAHDATALMYALYTSGSTGKPKGVLIEHRSLLNNIDWMQSRFGLDQTDCMIQKTPLSFDRSVGEIVWPLISGARLVIAKPDGHKDPAYLRQLIQTEQVTIMHFVPSMFRAILEEGGWGDCESLRYVFCGGEAMAADLPMLHYRQHNAPLFNMYGPTEATICCSYWQCNPADPREQIPIGFPLRDTELYILNSADQLQPVGCVGELCISGYCLARGYQGRAELTRERFVKLDLGDGRVRRVYRTGDLARWLPGGELEFIGRADNQISLNGFRIELGEIENQTAGLDSVKSAVVLLKQGEAKTDQLVCYIEPTAAQADNGSALQQTVKTTLEQQLPSYMVPAQYVVVEEMPLAVNGKVDRAALLALDSEAVAESNYVAPRNELEEILCTIWAEVLHRDKIGIEDNFFASGGDSILSIQLVAKAKKQGLNLHVRQVFEYPTVAELSPHVTQRKPAQTRLKPVEGIAPLLPIQNWFLNTYAEHPHHFNQSMLLNTPGSFSGSAMEQIASALYQKHDALRLRFSTDEEGVWTASHLPYSAEILAQTLAYVDLTEVAVDQRKALVESRCDKEQTSLDIAAGPIFRMIFFDYGEQPGRLFILLHHLVVDGVSWRIILADLSAAWDQCCAGGIPSLAGKTAAYKDWGLRLTEYAQDAALLGQRDYWLQQVTTPIPQLPCLEAPAGADFGIKNDRFNFQLDEAQTELLLSSCNAAFRTKINELLLAALLRAFQVWAGQPALRIEMEGHGRDELFADIDLTETVGWFTCVYPLVLSAPQNTSVEDLIVAVKEQYRSIPANGLGFGILKELAADQDLVQADSMQSTSRLIFNYLGQFDSAVNQGSSFNLAAESRGKQSALTAQKPELRITGATAGGKFSVGIVFSEAAFEEAAILDLTQTLESALIEVIECCVERNRRRSIFEAHGKLHSAPASDTDVEAIEI